MGEYSCAEDEREVAPGGMMCGCVGESVVKSLVTEIEIQNSFGNSREGDA